MPPPGKPQRALVKSLLFLLWRGEPESVRRNRRQDGYVAHEPAERRLKRTDSHVVRTRHSFGSTSASRSRAGADTKAVESYLPPSQFWFW